MAALLPRSRLRALLSGAGLIVIGFLVVLLWRRSVDVSGTDFDPVPKLPFEFAFQRLEHPALDQLRERENLDAVVSGVEDRFGKLVRLCHWTRKQWEPGIPKVLPPWHALAVLDLIRAGKAQGFCAQYAQVFAQACLSFGWQPRYIEMGPPNDPCAHFTTEVWIDPLGKWAVLDPFHDVWFEREGTPLSGLEIHRALVTGKENTVVVRSMPEGRTVENPRRRELIEAYYYLRLLRKMDHLSRPDGPFEWTDKVEWADPETVPWHQSALTNPKVEKGATAPISVNEPGTFDFPLNRAMVDVRGDRLHKRATLHLTHAMPGFDHYRVTIGTGKPQRLDGAVLQVGLERGRIAVEIVPVNSRGVEGVPSRLLLQ